MRIVDINRVGTAALIADEAWVLDSTSRRDTPTGIRSQLVVRPGPLQELEERMAAHKAAGGPSVVRLCPGPDDHDYPLEPWVLSPLPELCERDEITLLLDTGVGQARYPWADIVRLARAYPHLVVVALAAPLAGPTAQRALDATLNLVLETSALIEPASDDLAGLAEVAGAHRLVYGSGDRAIPASVVADRLPPMAAADVLAVNADLMGRGAWGAIYL